jgi:uncharacterized protein (TIGR02147 family)
LAEDKWEVISEWYHLAIMELTKTRGFKYDHAWISEKLGITKDQARLATARLVRMNILKESKGKLKVTGDGMVFSPNEIPSESIRRFHTEIMKKATLSLRTQSLEKRNFTSLVVAVDQDQISEAKALVLEFVRKLDNVMMSSKKKDKVYCFSSQFFALDEEASP